MPIQEPHISLIRRPLTPVSRGRGQDLPHERVTHTFPYGREYGFIPQFDGFRPSNAATDRNFSADDVPGSS